MSAQKNASKDKKRRRLIALTKKLREEKGIVMKKHELETDIRTIRKAQEEINKIAEQDASKEIQDYASETNGQLQSIIDDINYYMGIVYPEGLIDIGGPEGFGKSVMTTG